MTSIAIKERKLENISKDVLAAISMLKSRYKAVLTHDSNQTNTGATWIFTLPPPARSQVAIRMNKRDLSIYLRDRTLDGKLLEPLLGMHADVKKRYSNPDGSLAASLKSQTHAPYLRPSSTHHLLLIHPRPTALEGILDICLPRPLMDSLTPAQPPLPDLTKVIATSLRIKQRVSLEELLEQLDRNAAMGRAGEELALADELKRLLACGCSEPQRYVEHVAQTDVGRGYDIASTWSGQERYIEVKTTTSFNSDFFLTENERQVLAELGPKAWLYRILLTPDIKEASIQRVNDPIARIHAEAMQAVVWRIPVRALPPEK